MKPAKYAMSDSESDVEGKDQRMDSDNDDFIFNTEPLNLMSTDDELEFQNQLLSPVKKKTEKPKKNVKKSRNTEKKADKKPKVEAVKQPKPAELIKSLTVVIDSSLLNHTFGSELLAALRSADIRYSVQEQKLPATITWTLENDQSSQKFFENYIILLWTWKDLVDLIAERKLCVELEGKVKSLPNSKLTLLIFGTEEYFRKSKTWKNRETTASSTDNEKNPRKTNKREKTILSKMDVEFAVGELQLLNLQYRFFETGADLGLYIAQFTKALAELPQKLQRNKRLECLDWYATGDSKESIRVDAAGNGLASLWQQQICQFPNVTLEVAQAIVSNYSSPLALINAYDSCSSRKEAELLLQNIPIRRIHGPLTSIRKVGPELSKKIHQFFCGEDGNLFIS